MRHLPALLVLVGAAALASAALQMDVPALTRASTDVVRARVAGSRVEWTGDHQRLMTLVELEVLDSWKGTARGRLTVVQPGGERDGIGQRVSGVAPLTAKEEVVLFLQRQGTVHRVVGLAQGVYRVEHPSATESRAVPASLEGLALVVRGTPPPPRVAVSLDALRGQVRTAVQER